MKNINNAFSNSRPAKENKAIIKVNSNFHHAWGIDLFKAGKKRFSQYRRNWHSWPENFYIGNFPLFIDVEVTSACNLQCPFCASTYRAKKIKKGFMEFSILKKIVDEGARCGLYGVKFNVRGEPLLHKEIDKFVCYAKKKGLIDVYFNTNGMLLKKEISGKLIDAGLDRLSVSFEGYTKDFYEKNRPGAKFYQVLRNIDNLKSLKEKLGLEHPKLRIQTVMLPELAPHLDKYEKFWRGRVDEIAMLDYKEMKKKKKGIIYPWACSQLWQRMAIWWDGTILPCNHDDDGYLALGNVKDTSIRSAWLSKKLNSIRQAHKHGLSHTVKACDGCYLRDSEIEKLNRG